MKYHGFQPLTGEGGRFVIGLERIADMFAEIRPLHAAHYAETETLYLDAGFDPDYDRYIASEAANQFVVFTVRHDGKMVGYLQYYVFRDMHSQGMYVAREDAFFVMPEYRGKRLAPRLLTFAEHCLSQLGCKYVGMSNKAPAGGPDIGAFLERRGYKPVATFHMKQLGVAAHDS